MADRTMRWGEGSPEFLADWAIDDWTRARADAGRPLDDQQRAAYREVLLAGFQAVTAQWNAAADAADADNS